MEMGRWAVAEALHGGSYEVKASSLCEAGLKMQGGAGWGVGGLALAVGTCSYLAMQLLEGGAYFAGPV